MIEVGLIERDEDPHHRSKKRISPTEKGKALFERAVKLRKAYFEKIMQDLSAEDIKALDQALRSIALRVDEFRQESDDQPVP